VACAASQARAATVCDGNFQIVDGMSVSTPYCQDENLAAQQRKRGPEVSGLEIRRHPELKREACTLASPANETTCAGYTSD
jgi:hypothetical protein